MIYRSVHVTNNRFGFMRNLFKRRTEEFVEKAAEAILDDIVDHFTTSHSPSYPGEPPGIVTGNLRDSVEVKRTDMENVSIIIGADYAGYLEYGTEKMEPRPFVAPALLRVPKIIKGLKGNFNES
jgi:HK97 gp10 family phage protein